MHVAETNKEKEEKTKKNWSHKWVENICMRCDKTFRFKYVWPDDPKTKRLCASCKHYANNGNDLDYSGTVGC